MFRRLHVVIVITLLLPSFVCAQTDFLNKRVLVVYNSHGPESKKVAEYYMQKRAIPAANLCQISPPKIIRTGMIHSRTARKTFEGAVDQGFLCFAA